MKNPLINVLITGANGFVGKNLVSHLSQIKNIKINTFNKSDKINLLPSLISQTDVVIHLAGENRPKDSRDFVKNNLELTRRVCTVIAEQLNKKSKAIKFILASTTQVEQKNEYGLSKLDAEKAVISLSNDLGVPVSIFRFPGIFGKWCKPNYNSVVATFCYNIARKLPIKINDPNFKITLVYIDDVITEIVKSIYSECKNLTWRKVKPEYSISLGDLAKQIQAFQNSRSNLITEPVGRDLIRALHSTYLSYLPKESFSYTLMKNMDKRGIFVEMLKTNNCGQFSYFTTYPGVTRGEHYHHSKTEKFLVIKGKALFKFRNIINEDTFELETDENKPQIVESIPGWAHNIKNIGKDDMFVLLWANENFDPNHPDTITCKV